MDLVYFLTWFIVAKNNINLPSTPTSLRWSLSFRFSNQYFMYVFLIFTARRLSNELNENIGQPGIVPVYRISNKAFGRWCLLRRSGTSHTCTLTFLTACNMKMAQAWCSSFHYQFTFLFPHRAVWFLKCQNLVFRLFSPRAVLHIMTQFRNDVQIRNA
jgi:hypothetical protein